MSGKARQNRSEAEFACFGKSGVSVRQQRGSVFMPRFFLWLLSL